jgi:hypothetical protein
MRSEGSVLLRLHLALFVFLLFLLLDDAQELVALSFGLLGQHDLALDELSASSLVQTSGLDYRQRVLFFLFPTRFTFTLFEGTLGTQSVNLTLTVSSTLLQFSQSLDLELLLVLKTAMLSGSVLFLCNFSGVIMDDFQIFHTLIASLVRFAIEGNFIGELDFLEHNSVTGLFGLENDQISKLLLLNGAGQLLLFALTLLSLLNSLLLAFLNLVNNDSGSSALGLNS